MKIGSPLPHKKARIEIIPLIDIMFFLLACFMVVSLSMVQMRGIKVNMPTAASATPENKTDFVSITVDAADAVFLEKVQMDFPKLLEELKKLVVANPETRIYIKGDEASSHGTIVKVLDKVKLAGITKVAFEIRPHAVSAPTPAGGVPGSPVAPAAPAPPAAPAIPSAS